VICPPEWKAAIAHLVLKAEATSHLALTNKTPDLSKVRDTWMPQFLAMCLAETNRNDIETAFSTITVINFNSIQAPLPDRRHQGRQEVRRTLSSPCPEHRVRTGQRMLGKCEGRGRRSRSLVRRSGFEQIAAAVQAAMGCCLGALDSSPLSHVINHDRDTPVCHQNYESIFCRPV